MKLPFKNSIQLKDIDHVKMMNRVDTKYWFHREKLISFFNRIQNSYYVLEIEENNTLSYITTYFDTKDNRLYMAHHNGKLNRIKIRHRSYLNSGISFLEVKRKNNKGRTIKKELR